MVDVVLRMYSSSPWTFLPFQGLVGDFPSCLLKIRVGEMGDCKGPQLTSLAD